MGAITVDEQQAVRELLDSPEGQRLTALREADALLLRKAKATELAAIEPESLKVLTPLRQATAEAAAAVEAAQAALRGAQVAYGDALNAEASARSRYDRARDNLERGLRETADPRIGAFVGEMGGLFERVRQTPISNRGGVPDGRGGFTEVTSNAGAVQAKLAAINAARKAAESMLLEAIDGAEVAKRLAKLRAGIEAAS